ncbi:MAG: TonB-dependent receptor [Bacteroides sp.]|nr:TonB-dependent receptor [Bacteroides sp.]
MTISLEEKPLSILFQHIEEQSSYQIFSRPQETDSCLVTVEVTNAEPISLLENTLKRFGLAVHNYTNYIFIVKEKPFVTSLPEGFGEKTTEITEESEEVSVWLSAFNNRDQKATSENKVYEIGSPTTDIPNKVILTGTVTNFKNGEPVTGASIYIKELQTGAVTDPYGYYKIKLPGGRHELQIQGIGLEDTKRQVVLYANGKLDIELQEQVYALREVVISSEKSQNVRRTTLGMERLEISAIKNIPTAFGEIDIMRIVMSLPGVKSVGEASAGFNVRGGSTDQNLILFNEGTLYNPTYLFGFFSAINPDVVKDMELYKSSIPAQYGGRISSVLDINSREGNKKQFKGAVSLGVLTSRLTVEGPLFKDKTSFILGGRTTYSDWILKQLPEKAVIKTEPRDSMI